MAILAVMLYHSLRYLPERFETVGQFGWMGVDLFFVLSGYLIGYQLLSPYAIGNLPSASVFYRRRLFRILPAYLVVVALYSAWPAWREAPGFGPLWKFLTFTENLSFNPDFRAFSHVWSLCVEEHFYLVLPLLVIWRMRRPSALKTALTFTTIALLGIALRAYAIAHTVNYMSDIYYPTWSRLDGLLAGVALAVVRVFRPAWWASAMNCGLATLATGFLCAGSVVWLFRDNGMGDLNGPAAWGTVLGFPLLAIGLGLIVCSGVSKNGLLGRFPIPGARVVAALAFTLYLTHKAIVHLDRTYLPSLTSERDLRSTLVFFASCLAAAAALHFGVERPFLMLRDRMDGKTTPAIEREMLSEPAL